MVQAAQTKTQAPRGSLSRAQRKKIRGWRSDLGHAIWNLNESPLMHELRRKYEIQTVVLIALEIRKEMTAFVKRGGRIRKDARPMAKQYLDRLKGALEGIWLGVGYLRKLMPEYLDRFDIGAMLKEVAGDGAPEMVELMFFGFCPTEVATTRELPKAALTEVLEDRIEHLYVKEGVYKRLDLKGLERETQRARTALQKQLQKGEGKEVLERGGCYTNGMKALRASVMQMFYTLQARDVRRVQLGPDDSNLWHSTLEEMGEPPDGLVQQMKEMADEEGRVLHVFDKDGFLVYAAVPAWYTAEDPDSLMQRASLKRSRGARADWNYDYKAATPADAAALHQSLTPAERRRVAGMLERHRDPQTGEYRAFTLEEIASITEVPFRSAEQAAFQRKSAAKFGRNPDGEDRTTQIGQDYGLITALWGMDFG
jgi:hypothetical protein